MNSASSTLFYLTESLNYTKPGLVTYEYLLNLVFRYMVEDLPSFFPCNLSALRKLNSRISSFQIALLVSYSYL